MKKLMLFIISVFLLTNSNTLFAAEDFFKTGVEEFNAENYEEALVFFEKAYKNKPKDPRITSYLGLTHREMQNYKEAVRFLKETLLFDPKASEVKFLLSDVLFGMGSYEEALDITETVIKEKVNLPQSYYLKGLILLKLKRSAEAVESFKKAKGLDPAFTQQADFQIAVVYLQEREFKKAGETFKGLITTDPTSDWALFAKDYLEVLEKIPPPYRLNIYAGVQYDDNVLTAPLDVSLVDVKKQEDWKGLFSLLGEYNIYTKGAWNVKTAYSFSLTRHKERNYPKTTPGETIFSQDTLSHTVSILPAYNTESSVSGLLLSYSYLEVDYAKYMQSYTLNPSITFIIKGSHLGQVFLKYKRQDIDEEYFKTKFGSYQRSEENRDSNDFSGGLGYFYTFANGNGLFTIKTEGELNDADGDNWDYAGYKGSSGFLYPFIDNRLKINIFLDWYRQDFSNIHTVYKKKRLDDTFTLQTSIVYTLFKSLDANIGYAYTKDDSNIDVYAYQKNLYTVNFEYRF